MENNCYFVNSHGILKSCTFYSPNPISSDGNDKDYLNKMIESPNMFDKMSIYVCTNLLPYFLYNILPKINNTFYLISGDSDVSVTNVSINVYNNIKFLDKNICLQILIHPKLIKWFAQNCVYKNENNILVNEKITQLPIGMDYHTISKNPNKFWRDTINEGYSTKYQEMILKNMRLNMKPFYERINKIFVHMSNNSHRQLALDQIPEELIEKKIIRMHRTNIWMEFINYAFVYSPYGAGFDCHRSWEILCLGCIPIIKSFGSNKMFEDLPVLIVDEWSDITRKLLDDTIEKFKNTTFNYNKLSLKYWVDQFSDPPIL